MRNARVVAFLLALGCAFTSQAVVIHWAVDVPMSGTTEAVLVYVSSGQPSYTAYDTIANGVEVGPRVSGLAITPSGIGEQYATDTETRNGGAYYIVLFNSTVSTSFSWTPLAYNDPNAITDDVMTPAGSIFNPPEGDFTNWALVPEPSAAALLCLGAAALALRRRKRL